MTARDSLSALGEAALKYARRGWPVFPCEPRGKRPLCAHGLKDATKDEKVIRDWWTRWPAANVGYPTGELIVLDLDGADGEDALVELEKIHGGLPDTLAAKTGNGEHLYFASNGTPIRNSTGKLGPHLDIRAGGGYVILPPSVHENGTHYQWIVKKKPTPLPTWVSVLLAIPEPMQASDTGAAKIYKGGRNSYLTSLAGRMRRPGMSVPAIEAALLQENKTRLDPPLPDIEVKKIARSVGGYPPGAEEVRPTPGAVMVCLADVLPQPVRWLWPGRIPLGKLTILVGDPGLGKSLTTLDIVARVSKGMPFPDDARCELGSAIILTAEDDKADTVRPRLDALGADVKRVHLIEAVRKVTGDGKVCEHSFNLESDLWALERVLAKRSNILAIIIDPLSAYLGGTDSHANSEVRGLLAPLSALAAKHGVAIVAVSHLRKSPGAALHRAIGSIAFAAAARAMFAFALDPADPDRKLMLPVKQNLAPDMGGLSYRIEAPGGIARVVWQPGTVSFQVNDLLGGLESAEDRTLRAEGVEWLRSMLAHRAIAVKKIAEEAEAAGLSWRTIERAKASLRVTATRAGFSAKGYWQWQLPQRPPPIDRQPSDSNLAAFGGSRENSGESALPDSIDRQPIPLAAFEKSDVAEHPLFTPPSARERALADPGVRAFVERFDCTVEGVKDAKTLPSKDELEFEGEGL